MTTNGTRNPEQIESEIQQARSRLDDTIDAIQDKLAPDLLMDKALNYVRQMGSSDFMYDLGQTVKHNPVPLALIGIGLAWLMMSGANRNNSRPETGRDGYGYDPEIYPSRAKIYDDKNIIMEPNIPLTGDIQDRY